jgi:hypothetical protein
VAKLDEAWLTLEDAERLFVQILDYFLPAHRHATNADELQRDPTADFASACTRHKEGVYKLVENANKWCPPDGSSLNERKTMRHERFWCKLLKGPVSCDNCRDDGTDLGTRSVQGTAL